MTAQIPCGYEVSAVIQGPFCQIFGFAPTIPRDIGENGEVVGSYTECLIGPSVPFRWTQETGLVALTVPAHLYTWAAALDVDDETGWIVGAVGTPGTDGPFAVRWQGFGILNLGTLPGGDFSRAQASSNGRIVGRWGNEVTGDPGLQAFLWEDGVMIDLGPDLGTPAGEARDVNAAGQVVGWMGTGPLFDERAFIWQLGQVTDLGPIPGGFTSDAQAINSAQQVVGTGLVIDPETGADFTRAFYWDGNRMINLGILPGFTRSGASDISDGALVVGRLWGGIGNTGFVSFGSTMVDLNTLISPEAGVDILIAHAVNNAGQIACDGLNLEGDRIGILLTPIVPPLGDLDCDGSVSADDFWLLIAVWGPCPAEGACPADVNGDGSVGIVDLLTLLANWS